MEYFGLDLDFILNELARILHVDPLLFTLKQLQKEWDANPSEIMNFIESNQLSDSQIDNYLTQNLNHLIKTRSNQIDNDSKQSEKDTNIEMDSVARFLMSASIKDISIMITFGKLQ